MSQKEISAETLALSVVYRSAIAIDNDGTPVVEDGVFLANLQPNVTEEMLRSVKANNETHAAAIVHAFGNNAIDVMAANPAVTKVEAFIPTIARDGFAVEANRSRDGRNPRTGETTTKYGIVDIVHKTQVDNKNGGELKIIRAQLSESAAAKLTS